MLSFSPYTDFIVLWLVNMISNASLQVWVPSYHRPHFINAPFLRTNTFLIPVFKNEFKKSHRFLKFPVSKVGLSNGFLLAPSRRRLDSQNEKESSMPISESVDNSTLILSYYTSPRETKLDNIKNKHIEIASERMPEKSDDKSSLIMFLKSQSSNENVKKAMKLSVTDPGESPDGRVPLMKIPIHKDYSKTKGHDANALKCSQLDCGITETKGPVCACNHKTGNTVSFKNECDVKKHNCRFNTEFKTILHEICPWQFESISSSHVSDDLQHH